MTIGVLSSRAMGTPRGSMLKYVTENKNLYFLDQFKIISTFFLHNLIINDLLEIWYASTTCTDVCLGLFAFACIVLINKSGWLRTYVKYLGILG